MKIRLLVSLTVLSLTLTACAGGPKVRMDDDVRSSIKTVAINSSIELPDELYYVGATQNVANNFGLLGSLIGGSDKREKTEALENAMEKQGVDMSKVVYGKFAREMAQHTPYKPLESGSAADATMSINIALYGLQVAGAGSHLYPQLNVSAEMKSPDGKTIWRNRGTVSPLTKVNKAKYTYPELIAQPARLQEVMSDAAGIVAESVMADL